MFNKFLEVVVPKKNKMMVVKQLQRLKLKLRPKHKHKPKLTQKKLRESVKLKQRRLVKSKPRRKRLSVLPMSNRSKSA